MKKEKPYEIAITSGSLQSNNIVQWSYATKTQDLLFNINCDGGNLQTATSLLRRMLEDKRKVITKCFGQAESGGFVAFIGGDERISHKENLFLFHCGNIEGRITQSGAESLFNKSNICYQTIIKRLVKISSKGASYWSSIIKDGSQVYFTGKDLMKLGIVTKLI